MDVVARTTGTRGGENLFILGTFFCDGIVANPRYCAGGHTVLAWREAVEEGSTDVDTAAIVRRVPAETSAPTEPRMLVCSMIHRPGG